MLDIRKYAEAPRFHRKYGIGGFRTYIYAKSGESGKCFIPRGKHCIDDAQCRPGTLCVPWHGTSDPAEFRCGNFNDNDDIIIYPDKVIPSTLKAAAASQSMNNMWRSSNPGHHNSASQSISS